MRELSIFIDESGVFGPFERHSPFYIVSFVLHDQSDDIAGHLDKIHAALVARGLDADHPVHTGPLIRREQAYRWMGMPERRGLFRVLVDFVRRCEVTHHSFVFHKREAADTDPGQPHLAHCQRVHPRQPRVLRVVGSHRHLLRQRPEGTQARRQQRLQRSPVHRRGRKVVLSDYSLFQAADLCCTVALLLTKVETSGLSASERGFFSTPKDSAERALKKGYFKTMDAKRFGS